MFLCHDIVQFLIRLADIPSIKGPKASQQEWKAPCRKHDSPLQVLHEFFNMTSHIFNLNIFN